MFLGDSGYLHPDIEGTTLLANQRQVLRTFLNRYSGQHVLVSHSMGGLAARATYKDNPSNIAAIVTVATPHQGTPIALNGQRLVNFFRDVDRRCRDAFNAANLLTAGVAGIFLNYDFPDLTSLAQGIQSPALSDLRPDAAPISELNAWTGDAAIARGYVIGRIPERNAPIRVAKSLAGKDGEFEDAVAHRNNAKSAFKACKHAAYATIVLSPVARKCSWGDRALARVDPEWAFATKGVRIVRTGLGSYPMPRDVAFDGVVSEDRSVYPGVTDIAFPVVALGANHQNIMYVRTGIEAMANAMLLTGMRRP